MGVKARNLPCYRRKVKQVEGSRLNMTNVTRHHMGAYLCIASNGIPPTVSKRIMLKVEFPPTTSVHRPMVPAVVGDNAVLECIVEAYPKPIGIWTLPNNSNHSRQVVELTTRENRVVLSLNLTKVRPQDYGTYKCSAKNTKGVSEGVVRLYEVKPTTTLPPPTTSTTTSTTTTTTTPPPPRPPATPPTERRKGSSSVDKDSYDSRQEKKRKDSEAPENSVSSKNSREASTRGAYRPASSTSSSTTESTSLACSFVLLVAHVLLHSNCSA